MPARWGTALIIGAAASVAACGGGGGGSAGPAQAAASASGSAATRAAQGFWTGRTESGQRADFIILEDGSTWGVFASTDAITGGAQGTSAIESGRFVSSLTEHHFQQDEAVQVTYEGSGTPQSRIDALGSGDRRLVLDYGAGYDQPASAQALAGRYALDQETVLSISATGAFNWIASETCVLTGLATPRASGRNVFDLSLAYVGEQCPHPDGTGVEGVVHLDSQSSPPRLVALALKEDRGIGFISSAFRFQDPGQPVAPAPPAAAPAPAPASPAPAPAPAPPAVSTPLRISAGHYPPPGSCRIWVVGVPPGRQAPPGDCAVLERQVTPGAVLIRG